MVAAAQSSAWETVQKVDKQTWINIAICVVALIAVVKVWNALKKFNEFAPYLAAMVAGAMIFFYWVYDRSEPRFLTPVIERIAPFFPTKATQDRNRGGDA